MNEAWKQASQNEALDDHNGSWSDVQHDLQMKQTQSRITARELTYSRNCIAAVPIETALMDADCLTKGEPRVGFQGNRK